MDPKAKKILFSTYWKNGWIDSPTTPPADFAYSKSMGLMFDPFSISHDDCVTQLKLLVKKLTAKKVGRAFVSSLSSGRLDWRSTLASYAFARDLPPHKYSKHVFDGDGSHQCGICKHGGMLGDKTYRKEDLNVLNFERIKWAGVRHGDLLYTYLDLREFLATEVAEPTREDVAALRDIMIQVTKSKPGDRPSALEKSLIGAFPASKYDRQKLIEIFSCAGILAPEGDKFGDCWWDPSAWRGKFSLAAAKKYFGSYL